VPRVFAVDAALAAGSPLSLRPELLRRPVPPPHPALSPRFRPYITLLSSSPPPACRSSAAPPFLRFAASTPPRAAARSISATTAPQATACPRHNLHAQVSLFDPFVSTTVASPAPPSSAFVSDTNRARQRSSGDGGRRGWCRWTPLVETKLTPPSHGAAVAGVAGGHVGRGGGRGFGRVGSSLIHGLESFSSGLGSDQLVRAKFKPARASFVPAHPFAPNSTQ
jgi:hypothetical protein